MADLPILFSAPMVRALLAGTKTQTRRIIKPQPTFIELSGRWGWHIPPAKRHGCDFVVTASREWHEYLLPEQRPWHSIGDRLWVREAWRCEARFDDTKPTALPYGVPVYYEAGGGGEEAIPECAGRLRPNMFMMKCHSRITLYVTDVRVERLQEISEEDARAEGIEKVLYDGDDDRYLGDFGWRDYSDHPHAAAPFDKSRARRSYETLWESINGPGAWDANPWVAAYTFAPVLGNIDTLPATLEEAA